MLSVCPSAVTAAATRLAVTSVLRRIVFMASLPFGAPACVMGGSLASSSLHTCSWRRGGCLSPSRAPPPQRQRRGGSGPGVEQLVEHVGGVDVVRLQVLDALVGDEHHALVHERNPQ